MKRVCLGMLGAFMIMAISLSASGPTPSTAFGPAATPAPDKPDRSSSPAYQAGLKDGREDARRRRASQPNPQGWKTGRDRHDYEAGYNAGYQEAQANQGRDERRDRDRGDERGRDRDRGEDRGRDQGRPGNSSMASARNVGYQDGQNDGANDRRTGHSYRPTQGDNYKNATRGYNSSFGDKQQYKNTYREGYSEGYRRGYYGR